MSRPPQQANADAPRALAQTDVTANRFTEEALARHKREGVELATRARLIALAVVAVLLPILNPNWEVLYFECFILLFALNGWAQRRVARVGRSTAEFAFMLVDIVLFVFMTVYPPPFWEEGWPHAMTYRFDGVVYMYVLLAGATLMYNWRTIIAFGHFSAGLWALGVFLVWYFGYRDPDLQAASERAFGVENEMHMLLDPNTLQLDARVQEVVVFLIVAYMLGLTVRRFQSLLHSNAGLERERANLSRYFSPNVVDELSQNDTPLREVREQTVAVLFADLVGFTGYAADRPGREVIGTLRAFHQRMETCVFEAEGTLDKYLGDGLMATFGTPFAGPDDTARALRCSRAMLEAVDALNLERTAQGKEPLAVSIGLHVGTVVLGDIGANRLEFAVIGNTVNVASRMEGLTRNLNTRLVLSDDAYHVAQEQGEVLDDMRKVEDQQIRGLPGKVHVWAQNAS